MHHAGRRGRGPGIQRKIRRDNVGKVPVTSSGWSKLHRLSNEPLGIVGERHGDWHIRPW